MLGITMPSGRATTPGASNSIVTSSATNDPGKTLSLQTANLALTPTLVTHHRAVVDLNGNPTGAQYTWLSGPSDDDVTSEPSDPTLPLLTENVAVPNQVLRGVGFESGTYSDLPGTTPLTGAPTTELNSVHAPFTTPVYFPQSLATPNYFDALAGIQNGTSLKVTPAQVIQDGATTDTLRAYSSLGLRLYYDDNTTTYGTNTPALAGPPTISQVTSTVNSDASVTVSGHIAGDPSAGVQNVWVTYTGATSADPYYGTWQSVDLQQDPQHTGDSTLWTGTIPAPASGHSNDLFMVQAVSGAGVVAMDNNGGAYFTAGIAVGAPSTGAPTTLALSPSNPASGRFNDTVSVTATLGGLSSPTGRTITFGLGSQAVQATTDAHGVATATLPLNQSPGNGYDLTASYAGSSDAQSSSADAAGFTIEPAATAMLIHGPSGPVQTGTDPGVTATVTSAGQPLQGKSVVFVVDGPDGSELASVATTTNGAGQVSLGKTMLSPGADTVTAYFGSSSVPLLSGGTIDGSDSYYAESDASTTIAVTAPTTTVLTATDAAAVYGHSVVLTAVVAPSDGNGTVSFTADGGSAPIAGCGAVPLQTDSYGAQAATCTVPGLDAGPHSFRAEFAGTASYLASHGTTTTALAQASTTTTLSSPSSASYGSSVTLSATVATDAGAGRATGSVAFYDGTATTPVGSVPLPSTGPDTASIVVSGAQAATHAYRAVYSGDTDHATSAGSSSTIVSQEPTSTALSVPSAPAYGHAVVLTATVTPSDGGGTVSFAGGGGPVTGCTAVALTTTGTTGTATCSVTGLAIGPQSFAATYSGDGNLLTSSGSGATAVTKAATTISVSAPPSVTYPASVMVSATVATTGSGSAATGTVTFYDGTTKVGSASLPASGTVSTTLAAPGAATHALQAVYTGDGNYTGSSSTATTVVNQEVTGTALQAAPAVAGQAVVLTATVTSTDGGGTVGFAADGAAVAGCTHVAVTVSSGTGTATCSSAPLSVGTHSLGATYSGDTNDLTSSASPVTFKVGQAASRVTVSAPSSTRFGTAATVTATVAAVAPGAGQPSGTVTFSIAGGVVGSATLQVNKSGLDSATISVNGLQAGGNTLVATYAGDTSFAGNSGSAVDVVGFTSTLTGTRAGAGLVGAGESVLITGTDQGSIGVLPGGAVDITGTVAGTIAAPLGAAGFTMCGAKVTGAVTVDLSPGWTDIGGAACGTTTVSGAVALIGNTGGLSITKTSVSGVVLIEANSGRRPVQVGGAYPPPTISGNTITGLLSCSLNSPSPTDAGVANKVGQRSGQCATPATF